MRPVRQPLMQARQGWSLAAALALHGLALCALPAFADRRHGARPAGAERMINVQLAAPRALDAPGGAQASSSAPARPSSSVPPLPARDHAKPAARIALAQPPPQEATPAFKPKPASAAAVQIAPSTSGELPSEAVSAGTTLPAAPQGAPRQTAHPPAPPAGPAAAPEAAQAAQAAQAARPDHAYNPIPPYPPAARRFGLTGRVLMRVLVESDGAPREVLIALSSGHDMLDQAALKSVRAWRFLPARRFGEAYASWVEFPVRFELAN